MTSSDHPPGWSEPRATENLDGRAREHALVRQLELTVLEGPDAGALHQARGPRVVVGTHQTADLVLNDRTVSRFHCEVEVLDDRALVRDLDSRNGTLVNGTSILAAHLDEGALVTLGRTRVRIGLGHAQVELPLHPDAQFGPLVGGSQAMRVVFALLERAAQSEATVLLQGETGTGKDLAAQAIHEASRRAAGPFVILDCGAVAPSLLESALFGHERGAFTGAHTARQGVFEAAAGGTLFLDEIGELPPELQPRLLRALERKQVRPLGATQLKTVDVRVVAATHRNLRAEVNAERFRSDLYHRLSVLTIELPPLRRHLEDLPLLVAHLARAMGLSPEEAALLSAPELLESLARQPWSGNVRELRNYLERYSIAPSLLLLDAPAERAPLSLDVTVPLRVLRQRFVDDFERRYLEALLSAHDGNVTAAAAASGVARVHLHRLITRRGLRRGS